MDSQSDYKQEDKLVRKSAKSYAWFLTHILPVAIFFLLLILSEYYPELTIMDIIPFFIIPSIALCYFDRRALEKQSVDKLENWYIYVPPLYLWKRYQLLNSDKGYALEWIFAVIFFTGFIIFRNYGASILPTTACETVTEILSTQSSTPVSCKKVVIDEKVSKDFYLATAILDSGQKIDIAITKRNESEIYVEIVDGMLATVDTGIFSEPEKQAKPTKVWENTKPILGGDALWGNESTDNRVSEDNSDEGVVEGMGHDYSDPYYTDIIAESSEEDEGPEIRLSQEEIDELNQNAVN